jgi:hypothetical protein
MADVLKLEGAGDGPAAIGLGEFKAMFHSEIP